MQATKTRSSIVHLPSRRAGWNLIELMVVISIITILLAILINTAVEGKGPIEQTKVTLRGLQAAITEYEVSTGLKIDHASGPGPTATPIGRLLFALWENDKSRQMVIALGKEAVTPGALGAAPTVINDAWGKALEYYSGSGTLVVGMPTSNKPFVGSAGPDGKWGTIPATNVPDTDAKDNLFSLSLD